MSSVWHQGRLRPISRRRFLQGAAGSFIAVAGGRLLGPPDPAFADPATNPIVLENQNAGTTAFQLASLNGAFAGFATKTSYDVGEQVGVKLVIFGQAAPPAPQPTARLEIYRLGYYGGAGGRLVAPPINVSLPRDGWEQATPTYDPATGLRSAHTWAVTTPLTGWTPSVSGVYLVKISNVRDKDGNAISGENHIVFTVRDDNRPRDLLVVMPVNTWQAYNNWGNKSLYFYNSTGPPPSSEQTLAGVSNEGGAAHSRAVKASFNRPHTNVFNNFNWVLRTEFPLLHWLERQGYGLAYTDDVAVHSQPAQLTPDKTKTIVIAGHSEYWTREMRDNLEAARNAGTSIASFSANAGYWKVRYEGDAAGGENRTLVCFKTVEGTRDTGGQGAAGVNDFGPGATGRGGPNDPLGSDGQAQTADDRPQFATTTFRDPGAAQGAAQAPPEGRVGVNRPENALFGVLYIGDDDDRYFGLTVPPGGGSGGEFSDHPAWRHTDVAGTGRTIGSNLAGWEWDGIPSGSAPYQQAAAVQPAGVRRLSRSDPRPGGSAALTFLQDAGRARSVGPSAQPPTGQDPNVYAVTYDTGRARVFSAGTLQWSWGLGPHYMHHVANNYTQPPIQSDVDPRIQQATHNVLWDMGVRPDTPENTPGIVLDSPPSPPAAQSQPQQPQPPQQSNQPPVPADTVGPTLVVSRGTLRMLRSGVVRVGLFVPPSETGGVSGRLDLRTAYRVALGRQSPRRRIALGSRRLAMRGGQSSYLDVKLSRRAQQLLRRMRKLAVEVDVVARDAAGNERTTRAIRTLRMAPAAVRRK